MIHEHAAVELETSRHADKLARLITHTVAAGSSQAPGSPDVKTAKDVVAAAGTHLADSHVGAVQIESRFVEEQAEAQQKLDKLVRRHALLKEDEAAKARTAARDAAVAKIALRTAEHLLAATDRRLAIAGHEKHAVEQELAEAESALGVAERHHSCKCELLDAELLEYANQQDSLADTSKTLEELSERHGAWTEEQRAAEAAANIELATLNLRIEAASNLVAMQAELTERLDAAGPEL